MTVGREERVVRAFGAGEQRGLRLIQEPRGKRRSHLSRPERDVQFLFHSNEMNYTGRSGAATYWLRALAIKASRRSRLSFGQYFLRS